MSDVERFKVSDVYTGTNPLTIAMLEGSRAELIRCLDQIEKGVLYEVYTIPGVTLVPEPEH